MIEKKEAALFALLSFFAAATFFSCGKKNAGKKMEIEVKTFTAKKSETRPALESYGSVTYRSKNDVCALIEGAVTELNVKEGDKVEKGDILLKMKNIQYEIKKVECQNELNSAGAKLRAAKNNLEEKERSLRGKIASLENSRKTLEQKKQELALSKKNLEKNKSVFDAGGMSESAFEKMQVEFLSAKTEVEILERELLAAEIGFRDEDLKKAGFFSWNNEEDKIKRLIEMNIQGARIEIELAATAVQNAEQSLKSINSLMENLTVRAPSGGIVAALNFEKGERITQNEKILTLIDMEEPFALVSVQEKDMDKIALGSPALIEIESLGEKQKSQVDFISPLADSENGNFSVKIPLKNSGGKIRLGMFAQCSIESGRSAYYYEIPKEAVILKKGNCALFYCVQNGIAFQKECPIEIEKDGKIFVQRGLEDGEKIVLNPSQDLKEGMHVKEI